MKYFLLLAIFLFIPFFTKTYAKETSQALIINQVRGEECCDKGNLDNLKHQIENHIKYKVPAIFVIRYDALTDEKYINVLKKSAEDNPELIKLGILLEVTPNLAKDANVSYRGTNEDWFGAENLFSLGYSNEDNIKIADVLFNKFNNNFGYFPKVTSSWMIKTNLLNYLNEKYDVRINQITREQMGTDSYSLYGGPPHYPYPASSNWAMIPDYKRINAPLIVRQTVTDPLFNYGDTTSSYTSQPNDYMKNKNFDYFQSLTNQALLGQNETGFGLFGLENSMGTSYQKEYVKQISFLKKLNEEKKIIFPNIEQAYNYWKNQKITLYQGSDLVNKTINNAYWITTPNYRVRLRKENNKIFISDIRTYNSSFTDPYSSQDALNEGFWIVPYLLDSSQKINSNNNFKLSLFKSQPMSTNNFSSVITDINNNTNRIELPDLEKNKEFKIIKSNKNVFVQYYSTEGKQINISFLENNIKTNNLFPNDFKYVDNHEPSPVKYKSLQDGFNLSWNINNGEGFSLNTKCKNNNCDIQIKSNPNLLSYIRTINYEYLYPEPANHPLDRNKTIAYANNKYAIAGRNPVRIIVIPYDKFGLVTTLKGNKMTIQSDLLIKHSYIQQGKRFFVDFYSDKPTSTKINLILSKNVEKQQTIYFAPNCKIQIKICITNPKYSWWYLNAIAGDKIRQILYKERQ